jgi:16S rRNA (guanine966-N2)-methyltransferase
MRIVGGRLKGRVLKTPSSRVIRPTSERLRESIFDILEHRFPGRIEGARVLDLFAGSGALGAEALSRGARFALFVDNGAEARAVLRANVEALALGVLDPPYGHGLADPALASLVEGGWLEPNALCIVEEAAKAVIAGREGLTRIDERIYGDTQIVIFQAPARAAV